MKSTQCIECTFNVSVSITLDKLTRWQSPTVTKVSSDIALTLMFMATPLLCLTQRTAKYTLLY